jgi:predicted lipoprotein with Yx(FWY)xxD motif
VEFNALFYLGTLPDGKSVVVDSKEKTAYRFSKDSRGSGVTHCYGHCAGVWRPKLTVGQPHGESRAFHPENFGAIRRRNGARQATYLGWPLYTYTGEGPGEFTGLGASSFGGTWYALGLDGRSIGSGAHG